MSRYFGTDGFRGEANINLTADHATRWAVSWAGITMKNGLTPPRRAAP